MAEYHILMKPHITEKTAKQSEEENKYVFIVDRRANKIQIKDAIEKMYGVTVSAINTCIRPAKKRTRFTRRGYIQGKTKVIKKATVTLAENDTIDFYSNV